MAIDFDIASKEFIRRYRENSAKAKIVNEKLIAGSPMYYYCHGCQILLAVWPETHLSSPPIFCAACNVLNNHGMLDRLIKEANEKVS